MLIYKTVRNKRDSGAKPIPRLTEPKINPEGKKHNHSRQEKDGAQVLTGRIFHIDPPKRLYIDYIIFRGSESTGFFYGN